MAEQTQQMSDKHRAALKRYDVGVEYERDNLHAAMDDLRFRAGDQWPAASRLEREQEGRPVLTINRTGQFVRQVTGDIRQTRPAIKVRGADDQSDPETADVLTGLIRNIENQSDARAAYYSGADSQVAAGIGHWRVNTRYIADDVFDQDVVVEPISNSVQVIWDPDAKLMTREDAQWCFVPVEFSLEKFKEDYPDASPVDFENEHFLDEQRTWFSTETVTVAEYFEKQPVKKQLAQLSDGRVVDVTDMSEGQIAVLDILRVVERDGVKVMRYVMNGQEMLDEGVEWPGKYIPIIPCIGEEIDTGEKIVRHGVVRFLKDPQQIYNYWRTAQTEQIALQPKAPFIGTHKMFAKNKQAWEDANYSNAAYLAFEPDPTVPGLRPERQAPPQPSAGITEQVIQATEDMNATVGIYPAALGQQSNETSGVAIRQRQQEGDVGTFVYMDNFARAVSYTGRVIIDLIPHYYDTERVVRILNEDGTEEFAQINQLVMTPDGPMMLHDLAAGKYDVVAEIGPSYSTKRQEAAEGMREFIQALPEHGALIADMFVKAQDWPMADEISERLRKALPPGMAEPEEGEEEQGPTPEQIAQAEAQAAEQAAVEQEQQRQQAELQIKAQDAETKRLTAENQMEFNLTKVAVDARQAQADREAEIRLKERELDLHERKLELERDGMAIKALEAARPPPDNPAPAN